MIYRIVHRTTYKYKYPVSFGNHVACLKPRSLSHHKVAGSELRIQPPPATRTERVDYFGNLLCFFTIQEPHKELVVEALSEVIMEENATPWPQQSLPWEEAARLLPNDHSPSGLEAYQFGFESARIRVRPEFASYALQSFTPGRPMPEALLDLTARIHNDFRFDSKVTNVRTPTEEVFRKRRVPGFRALANRLPPLPESRGPLCKRIPSNVSTSRATEAGGRRCLPRLGVRLLSRIRLA
jgi:transglutaminase-like putative cysteine protease